MKINKKFWIIFSVSSLVASSAIIIPTTILTTQKKSINHIKDETINQNPEIPNDSNDNGGDNNSNDGNNDNINDSNQNPDDDKNNNDSNNTNDGNDNNLPETGNDSDNIEKPTIPPSTDNTPENDITLTKNEAEILQKQSYQYGFEPNKIDSNIIYNNKQLTNNDITQMIKDRTFSISFVNVTGSNNILPSLNGGTAWLLDYAPINDSISEGFKLFLATNFHVARLLVNKNDYDEYKQNNIINNGGYTQRMVLSWKEEKNGKTYSYSYKNNGLAKTLFMAQNFINDEKADEYMKNYLDEKHLNHSEYNSYYTDFAVLELNFHNAELEQNSDDARNYYRTKDFSEKISRAINVVDNSINQFKNNIETKNNNGLLPYAALSYIDTDGYNNNVRKSFTDKTLLKDVDKIKQQQKESDEFYNQHVFHNFKNYDLTPINAYTYGYPWTDNQGSFTEATTIPSDSIDKNKFTNQQLDSMPRSYSTYDFIHMNYELVNNSNTNKSTVFWNNKKMFANYGNAYRLLIPYNGTTTGGMSGSLVVNEQALPIGLIFGEFSKNIIYGYQYEYVWTMYFIPFANNIPIIDNEFYNNDVAVQSYNLIDGTNKKLYPLQTNSYKHSLTKHHPDLKTKLFEN